MTPTGSPEPPKWPRKGPVHGLPTTDGPFRTTGRTAADPAGHGTTGSC